MGKFGDQVSVISMTWVEGDHLWARVGRRSASGYARVYRYANVGTWFIKSDDLLRLMLTEGKSELAGTYAHTQCRVYSR